MVRNPLLKKANKLPQSASRNNKNHLSTENTELALNLDNYINNSIKTFCVCIHCLFSFFSHQFKYLEHMAFLQCTAPCFGSVRASRLSLAAGIYRTMLPATLNTWLVSAVGSNQGWLAFSLRSPWSGQRPPSSWPRGKRTKVPFKLIKHCTCDIALSHSG